jgi:soluble lytic murein transglycosylase
MKRPILSILLALSLLAPGSAHAVRMLSDSDAATYREAFTALSQKRGADAVSTAARASDPLLQDVITGLLLGQEDSSASFTSYVQFLDTHRNWPEKQQRAIARQAEQHMDAAMPDAEVLGFFKRYPPISDEGFRRYVTALQGAGDTKGAGDAIRKRWRDGAFGEKEEELFLHSYSGIVTANDTSARLDRLLWDGQFDHAKRLFPLISPGMRKVVTARIAMAENARNAEKALRAVPVSMLNDKGLMYERIRQRFKANDVEGAVALLEEVGLPSTQKDEWWNLRNRGVRELLQIGQYRRALTMALRHGMESGQGYAEAEFLAGWIGLRFLNEPQPAIQHFQNIYMQSNAPVTLSRAAYWTGRAMEAAGDEANARIWYGKALVYGTTYYGQLAAAKLYRDSRISVPAANITPDAQAQFDTSSDTARIVQLEQAGEPDLAQSFALALARSFSQEQDFRMLCNLAVNLGRGNMAVRVAKEAAKKKILLPGEGYPLLAAAQDLPREQAALVHALIRQESEFDPNALSTSDARGLMQMLPNTAKHVARTNSFGDEEPNLFDTATSLRYGSAYVAELQSEFNGFLPLVIASYNAVPSNVKNWVARMGNPAEQRIDSVDWIESIPFSETRNYVQRVLEGLQIYRARLSGGSTMLALESDLRMR